MMMNMMTENKNNVEYMMKPRDKLVAHILYSREEVIESLQTYQLFGQQKNYFKLVRPLIYRLFMSISNEIDTDKREEYYSILTIPKITDENIQECIRVFREMDAKLYNLNITKIEGARRL